ncbi:MAG: class I SAM-dependent methyltransferase [Methanomethylophilus sp.]
MNQHHIGVTIWGLRTIPLVDAKTILDVGCGGGMCLRKLSEKYPAARLTGIDLSTTSVEATTENNADLVAAGRLTVRPMDVEKLDFPENSFDLVTAVETYFFWPHLAQDIKNVARVVAPGGLFVIIAEDSFTEKNRTQMLQQKKEHPDAATIVENDVMMHHLREAGLRPYYCRTDVLPWVAFIARKPPFP